MASGRGGSGQAPLGPVSGGAGGCTGGAWRVGAAGRCAGGATADMRGTEGETECERSTTGARVFGSTVTTADVGGTDESMPPAKLGAGGLGGCAVGRANENGAGTLGDGGPRKVAGGPGARGLCGEPCAPTCTAGAERGAGGCVIDFGWSCDVERCWAGAGRVGASVMGSR